MKASQKHPPAPLHSTGGAVSAEDLRAVSAAIADEYPLTTDEQRLILMDVDPFHLHVYWNHSAVAIESARRSIDSRGESAHLVIRFRELPPPDAAAGLMPLEAFDLELDASRGDAEVRLSGSGKRFQAELGLTAADGGWTSLDRSNPIQLPPAAAVAEPGFETWDVSEALPPVEQMTGQSREQGPIAEPPPELDPSLRGGGMDELQPLFPNPKPLESPSQPAADDPSQHVEAAPTHPAAEAEAEGAALALPGYGPQLTGHQGTSSSAGMVLEVQAELHLWGQAEPGRTVKWFGHELPVQPDGRFDLTLPVDSSDPGLPLLLGKPGHKTPSA